MLPTVWNEMLNAIRKFIMGFPMILLNVKQNKKDFYDFYKERRGSIPTTGTFIFSSFVY